MAVFIILYPPAAAVVSSKSGYESSLKLVKYFPKVLCVYVYMYAELKQ